MKGLIEKIKGRSIPSLYRSLVAKVWDLHYDFKYNIDTDIPVQLEKLDLSDEQKKHSYWYEGTKGLPLKKLFHHLQIPKEKIFIDFGSGKGRALLVAAEYGFEKVIGVELSRDLYEIARRNVSNFKHKGNSHSDIEIINKDALDYVFKDDEDVLFLYNPFDDHTLNKLIINVKNSIIRNKRNLKIIYANAVHRKVIEENLRIIEVTKMSFYNVGFSIYDVH